MKSVTALLLLMLALAAWGENSPISETSGFKGEFILSRNKFNDPVCMAFTRNLNQFRKLPFDKCHPRISREFPEFSRPYWEEIPFDLQVAQFGVKSGFQNQPERAEQAWQKWQQSIESLIRSGQARMWRTRIDLDGDGKEETLIRIVPDQRGIPPKAEPHPFFGCDYNRGNTFLLDDARPQIVEFFNSWYHGTDVIHFSGNNHYYLITWNPFGPANRETDIGATSGVVLSKINWNGYLVTGGEICHIDWVPSDQIRSPKQRGVK